MEKTATPQAKPKNKHFWNFQPASGDNPPELILYGDIASETWWGDEVTPRQFTEELDALGAVPEIVVRINSGGGDVFAANAIYTRLKDNAAKITVKIDGWAASAATIIAMAGDSIEIPGNGVFMVHDPALGLLGYFNETELAKMTDELKVIKQSIVNAYTLKTGKDAADVAAIMAAETWYDGKQAVDAGFCDKLMFEDAETTVENAAKVVVNSVSLDLTRFPNMPVPNGGSREQERIHEQQFERKFAVVVVACRRLRVQLLRRPQRLFLWRVDLVPRLLRQHRRSPAL